MAREEISIKINSKIFITTLSYLTHRSRGVVRWHRGSKLLCPAWPLITIHRGRWRRWGAILSIMLWGATATTPSSTTAAPWPPMAEIFAHHLLPSLCQLQGFLSPQLVKRGVALCPTTAATTTKVPSNSSPLLLRVWPGVAVSGAPGNPLHSLLLNLFLLSRNESKE